MYDLTHSAWDLGLVGLFQFLPALALVLVAGQVVDRFHRARIAALCMAAQALVALALVWGSASHFVGREMLLIVSVAVGTVRAFQMPTQQALTPMVLPPALLPRGLAFSAAGHAEVRIVARPGDQRRLRLRRRRATRLLRVRHGALRRSPGSSSPACATSRPARVKKAISLETLLAGVRFVAEKPPSSSAPSPARSLRRAVRRRHRRCCRSSRATCCTSAPGVSACCAPPRPPARSRSRSC